MKRLIWDAVFLLTGSLFTYGQVQENSTASPAKHPLAAAVRSHFDDCPDSHSQFCFHGTCRFLIQEETPACVCHPGFVGMRCEHADLLAVVATNQKQQTMTTLLVMCIMGCVLLMLICTLLQLDLPRLGLPVPTVSTDDFLVKLLSKAGNLWVGPIASMPSRKTQWFSEGRGLLLSL